MLVLQSKIGFIVPLNVSLNFILMFIALVLFGWIMIVCGFVAYGFPSGRFSMLFSCVSIGVSDVFLNVAVIRLSSFSSVLSVSGHFSSCLKWYVIGYSLVSFPILITILLWYVWFTSFSFGYSVAVISLLS